MKRISILGSTGSIGRQSLDVVESLPGRFEVVGLAAGSNIELAAEQILRHRPAVASVSTEEAARKLCAMLEARKEASADEALPEILFGAEGIERVATHPDAQMVISAAVGVVGLLATYRAIECGKDIALANKEVLVAAGEVVMRAVQRHEVALLPVDSEHNAIHQCLRCGTHAEVRRLVLTASGGPFRETPLAKLARVTPKQALAHPNWKMGRRITIDSATMMNKGFEVIEACRLFGLPASRVKVMVHPQSTIHSLVEFVDGSILAQLSVTDMRLPILYALTWPERIPSTLRYSVSDLRHLDFRPPDMQKFPCLALAYEAAEAGGARTVALNAADEVAVAAFLAGSIAFDEIPRIIRDVLKATSVRRPESIEHVLTMDAEARQQARDRVQQLKPRKAGTGRPVVAQ